MKISKQYVNHYEGGDALVIDERDFADVVAYQLQQIRETAKDMILAVAPDYKQRNAALGLLTQQETNKIKADIESIRTVSNQKEAEIFAVVWDGTEATRPAACDAVQAVRWD